MKSSLTDIVEKEPLHPEFEWAGETSRHVGTLVHREIERLARAGIESSAADSFEQHRFRFHVALAELGVPPHLRAPAAEKVIEALTRMLRDERGRWLLAGSGVHREAVSELALSGLIGTALINGVIDRTIVTQDGTRWIVDFKTSTHEGGGLEEFLVAEETRYRPQLQLYAELMRGYRPGERIRAALYFPLLGAWREVAFR